MLIDAERWKWGENDKDNLEITVEIINMKSGHEY